MIDVAVKELIEQVAVGPMYLNAVKAGRDGIFRADPVLLNYPKDFIVL
jgi:hypothetical protein